MFIFIITVIVVFFISLCFFKSKFWEYRYLVLLISGGVALVATLTTNFIIRGHLQTKVEVISTTPLYTFYVQESLFKNGNKTPFLKKYDYYWKHDASEFFKHKLIIGKGTVKDSLRVDSINKLHKQIPLTILLYTKTDDSTKIFVGTFCKEDKQNGDEFNEIYIVPSQADSIAYRCKKKLIYDVPKSNWLTGFSFPRINTITILYIPPKEYKTIPDSLIRKIPF